MLNEEKTHTVHIEADVPVRAETDGHAEMVVKTQLEGKGFEVTYVKAEEL